MCVTHGRIGVNVMQCCRCKTQNPDGANFCKVCGTNLKPELTEVLSEKFAGFWIRAVSAIIDFFVLVLLAIITRFSIGFIVPPLIAIFFGIKPDTVPGSIWETVLITVAITTTVASVWIIIFAGIFYEIWMHVRFGQTIGKMITGIRVVTLQNAPVPYKLSLLRCFGKILNFLILGAGFISAGFHPQKRSLHDVIANTKVLYLKK